MSNPAYVTFRVQGDSKVGVRGPMGFTVGYFDEGTAEGLAMKMNEAFREGAMWARRVDAAQSVPGPPSPPRKFHPTEVG